MPATVSVATSKSAKPPKEGFRFLRRDEGRLSYSQQILPESPANAPSEGSNGEVITMSSSATVRASSVPGRERRDSKALREAIAYDMRNAKSRDHLGKVVVALPKKTQPPSQGGTEENTPEEKHEADQQEVCARTSTGGGEAGDIRSLHPSRTAAAAAAAAAASARRSASNAASVCCAGSSRPNTNHPTTSSSSTTPHAARNSRARATSRGLSVSRPPWVDIDVPPVSAVTSAPPAPAAGSANAMTQPNYSAAQLAHLTPTTMTNNTASAAEYRGGARRQEEGSEGRERWNAAGRGPYGGGGAYASHRGGDYDDHINRAGGGALHATSEHNHNMHANGSDERMDRVVGGGERGYHRYVDPTTAEAGNAAPPYLSYSSEKNFMTPNSPALVSYAAGPPSGVERMANYFRRDAGAVLCNAAAGSAAAGGGGVAMDAPYAPVGRHVGESKIYTDNNNNNNNNNMHARGVNYSNYTERNSAEEELVARLEKEVWAARQERERYLHLRDMLDADREQHMQRQRLAQQELSEERAAMQTARERMQREAQKEVKAMEERYRNVSALLASERGSSAQLAQENESLRRQLESLTTAMRDGQAMQRAEATRLRREVDSLTRRNAELLAMTQEQQMRILRAGSAAAAASGGGTSGSSSHSLAAQRAAAVHVLADHADAEGSLGISHRSIHNAMHTTSQPNHEVAAVLSHTGADHRAAAGVSAAPAVDATNRTSGGDGNYAKHYYAPVTSLPEGSSSGSSNAAVAASSMRGERVPAAMCARASPASTDHAVDNRSSHELHHNLSNSNSNSSHHYHNSNYSADAGVGGGGPTHLPEHPTRLSKSSSSSVPQEHGPTEVANEVAVPSAHAVRPDEGDAADEHATGRESAAGVAASNATRSVDSLSLQRHTVGSGAAASTSPLNAALIDAELGTASDLFSADYRNEGDGGRSEEVSCVLPQTPVVMDFTPHSGDAEAKKRRAREMEEHLRREDEERQRRRQQRQQQQQQQQQQMQQQEQEQHNRASSLTPRSPRSHLQGNEGVGPMEHVTRRTKSQSHRSQQQPVSSSAADAVRSPHSSQLASLSTSRSHHVMKSSNSNSNNSGKRRTASVSAAAVSARGEDAGAAGAAADTEVDATATSQDARRQRAVASQIRSNSTSLVRRNRLGSSSISVGETAATHQRKLPSEKAASTSAPADHPSSVAAAKRRRVSSLTPHARSNESRDHHTAAAAAAAAKAAPPSLSIAGSREESRRRNNGEGQVERQRSVPAGEEGTAEATHASTTPGATGETHPPTVVPSTSSVLISSAVRRIPTREELIGEIEPAPEEELPNDAVVSQSNIGDNPNKHESLYRSGKRVLQYSNGTVKMILPSGHTILHFTNKDVKRTYPSGRNTYWYESAQTTHTQLPDGVQIFEFHATGQIERHLSDGSKEILYPDGSFKVVHADGSDDVYFPH